MSLVGACSSTDDSESQPAESPVPTVNSASEQPSEQPTEQQSVEPDDSSFAVPGFAPGESQPVAPNENADGSDNPAGRQLNRRVEIFIPAF